MKKIGLLMALCMAGVIGMKAENAGKDKQLYTTYNKTTHVLTFYYDEYFDMRSSDLALRTEPLYDRPNYGGYVNQIEKAVFDESFSEAELTSTSELFCYEKYSNNLAPKNMRTIDGMEYLNTSKVTNMYQMFAYCESLEEVDLSYFNTSKVTDMSSMFWGCKSLTTLDLTSFDVSNVTTLSAMFYDCSSLTTIYCEQDWTLIGMDADDLFEGCTNLVGGMGTTLDEDHLYLDYARPDGGEDSPGYFTVPVHCTAPTDFQATDVTANTITLTWTPGADETQWKVMYYMLDENGDQVDGSYTEFETDEPTYTLSQLQPNTQYQLIVAAICGDDDAYLDDYLYITTLDGEAMPEIYVVMNDASKTMTFYYDNQRAKRGGTTDWTYKYGMDEEQRNRFWSFKKAVLDESMKDARPTSTYQWFYNRYITEVQHLDYLNTSEVTDMSSMFASCPELKAIDLSRFNTEKVTDMSSMFNSCQALKELDLRSFKIDNVTDMYSMFAICDELTTIYCNEDWSTSEADSEDMFNYSEILVGGNGTVFDANHTDKSYARPDEDGQPGYFTAKKTGIQTISSQLSAVSHKILRDGMMLIERNGKLFNAQGIEIR